MSDWKLPWEGACRCGQVRIRVSAPPIMTGACHCTGTTMLDGDVPARLVPFVETFAAEKLPFAQTGAVHSFDTLPPMEAWLGLM